ncbi:MAG: hypothetical protein AABX11_00795 [Nanoarchaeota archaeon]
MNREEIISLANLLSSLKEDAGKLDSAFRENDAEKVSMIKREMLNLTSEIDKIL